MGIVGGRRVNRMAQRSDTLETIDPSKMHGDEDLVITKSMMLFEESVGEFISCKSPIVYNMDKNCDE